MIYRCPGTRWPGSPMTSIGFQIVTPDERWLAALWPSVRAPLPAPPARVLEIGCGHAGGFVPMLQAAGYAATGIDPEAPDGPGYRQVEFERYQASQPADAIIACTSLHHVADLGQVLDLVAAALAAAGVAVVVEWARERFDEATARWCFDRLPAPGDDRGWLNDRYEQWQASGRPWDVYCRSWADGEGLHAGGDIVRELQARFDTGELSYGAYFFADLRGTGEADELAAIDAGQIRANRIQYHGRRREMPA
jgi:SAM-dependent methyltransferase